MNAEQERKHRELAAVNRQRIDRVREILRAYDAGGLSEGRALSQIEEIASGEGDRIVRVGHSHTPELTT